MYPTNSYYRDNNQKHNIIKVCLTILGLALFFLQPATAWAVIIGQVDTFESGSRENWQMGQPSITTSNITNLFTGGPAGTGDNYLEVSADGSTSGGGKLTFFNQSQWTGDYLAAGITAISMDLINFSSAEVLNIRLGINGGVTDPNNPGGVIGGQFVTSASASLISGSGWVHVVFSLNLVDLMSVSGRSGVPGNDALATLGNVKELRLLNSAVPDWSGQPVIATLGIDNVTAVVPIPSALLLFISGLIGLCLQPLRDRRNH